MPPALATVPANFPPHHFPLGPRHQRAGDPSLPDHLARFRPISLGELGNSLARLEDPWVPSQRVGRTLKPEEARAQRVIALALGRVVDQHDDNSAPSMYDLRVGPEANPDIAIEVTGAVDPELARTWNSGPAQGPERWPLVGDWTVLLETRANHKRIKTELPSVLQLLESQSFEGGLPVDHVLRRRDRAMWEHLDGLGIGYLTCYRRPGSGEVSFTMAGRAGRSTALGRAFRSGSVAGSGSPARRTS